MSHLLLSEFHSQSINLPCEHWVEASCCQEVQWGAEWHFKCRLATDFQKCLTYFQVLRYLINTILEHLLLFLFLIENCFQLIMFKMFNICEKSVCWSNLAKPVTECKIIEWLWKVDSPSDESDHGDIHCRGTWTADLGAVFFSGIKCSSLSSCARTFQNDQRSELLLRVYSERE